MVVTGISFYWADRDKILLNWILRGIVNEDGTILVMGIYMLASSMPAAKQLQTWTALYQQFVAPVLARVSESSAKRTISSDYDFAVRTAGDALTYLKDTLAGEHAVAVEGAIQDCMKSGALVAEEIKEGGGGGGRGGSKSGAAVGGGGLKKQKKSQLQMDDSKRVRKC